MITGIVSRNFISRTYGPLKQWFYLTGINWFKTTLQVILPGIWIAKGWSTENFIWASKHKDTRCRVGYVTFSVGTHRHSVDVLVNTISFCYLAKPPHSTIDWVVFLNQASMRDQTNSKQRKFGNKFEFLSQPEQSCVWNFLNENSDIAIAMSFSRADPVLVLNILSLSYCLS